MKQTIARFKYGLKQTQAEASLATNFTLLGIILPLLSNSIYIMYTIYVLSYSYRKIVVNIE